MAADRGVALVIDRPGAEQRLGRAEQLLDHQELAVAQHRLERRELAVGAQHEQAVEAGIGGDAGIVDLEVTAPRRLQVAAIRSVAHQRLVALLELAAQAVEDRAAVRGSAFGFGCIATDDVTVALDLWLPE
jgi:hypothetical protein